MKDEGENESVRPLNLEEIVDEVMDIICGEVMIREERKESIRKEIMQALKNHIKRLYLFYTRYRGKPGLLIEEHPEFKKDAVRYWSMALQYDAPVLYETWLFDIAFADVLKDE